MNNLKNAAIAVLVIAGMQAPVVAAEKDNNASAATNDTQQLQTWRKPGCSGDCSIIIR